MSVLRGREFVALEPGSTMIVWLRNSGYGLRTAGAARARTTDQSPFFLRTKLYELFIPNQ